MEMHKGLVAAVFGLCLCAGLACVHAQPETPEQPDQAKPQNSQDKEPDNAIDQVKFPGLTLDPKNNRVDVDAKVSLGNGLLEVIACTADSREHESIVVIQATPMHLHAALLLLGANNGNPAMMKPANEEKTQWIHLPPRGDPIAVSLVITDQKGKSHERPISDFIQRGEDAVQGFDPDPVEEDAGEGGEKLPGPAEVFATFVFAGSQVVVDNDGKKHYVADYNGNVVSISTFGDEVVCLPEVVTKDNNTLPWEVNPKHLPKVGTAVKLRLTLVKDGKDDQAEAGKDGQNKSDQKKNDQGDDR